MIHRLRNLHDVIEDKVQWILYARLEKFGTEELQKEEAEIESAR